MAITNSLKKQIDLPVWEWTRFAPAVSSAISCSCSADNSLFHEQNGRYIYYLISASGFWRYDTVADSYMQLTSPPIAPATWSSMKFLGAFGQEDLAIAATASTITIAGFFGKVLKGFDIVIVSGTGRGQRRTITDIAEAVSADSGIVTAVSNVAGAISITDSTKAWAVNQWVGYNVRITSNTGVGQVRKVLYNSATVITLGDINRSADDALCNPAIFSPAINATAGTQANYSIESSVATVDTNWAVTPDTTSQYRIQSGVIMLASSAAATPFYTSQWYDIATDTWYVRTSGTLTFGAVGTDGAVERTTENASVWERGIATGGTTTTLVDTSKSWKVNQYAGYYVRVFSGTGEGQIREIASNTDTTLTWVTVGTAPTTTSQYVIEGFDCGTATSGATSTLTDSTKAWTTNRWANYAVKITAGTGMGQVASIASNTDTVLTVVKPWAVTPDNTSVYCIQGDSDRQYLVLGASAGTLIQNINDDLPTWGRLADSGVARNASVQFADQKAMTIASVSNATTTATITTTVSHSFKVGQSVVVRGCTDANFNGTFTIATVPSLTTFTYTMGGTPASTTLANAQSTTTISDATKSWTVNQWAGYMVYMTTTAVTAATGAATMQAFQIASNTATTLTFVATGTAPTNGVSRYIITPRSAVGALDNGIATGSQSTTTLQDTSKTWVVNIFAGKRVKFIGGTGISQELLITSNTANTLTFGVSTAPVAGNTSYVILEQPARGTGTGLNWAFGQSDASQRGRYLFSPRGGAAIGFDRLDIPTDRWQLMPITPQIETLTTGSMYAYDGHDRLYFTKDATQRVYYLDVVTNTVNGASQFPYAAPTAVIGNRMEIFETEDGLRYLWLNRSSFTECFRTLLFY